MPMSDYYTCRYRYAAALPMCSCPAMCREMIVATRIDIKKDCKNCRYYRAEELIWDAQGKRQKPEQLR